MKYKCFDKDDRQELCTETMCSSASVNVTSDILSLRMCSVHRIVMSQSEIFSS